MDNCWADGADWHSDDGELVVGWLDDCNDVPPFVLELELLFVLAGDEAVGILVLLLVY